MAYANSFVITIPAAQILATVVDYPLLVTGTYAQLIGAAFGGVVQSGVGDDIIFSLNALGTSPLDFERGAYRASDGRVQFNVRTQPVFGVDYILYCCFNDPTVTIYQGTTSTWSSAWRAVYHFGDGATLSGVDSTANGNTGTPTGSPAAVTGQIIGGASFTGTTSALTLTNSTSLRLSTPFTFRFWVNLSSYNAAFAVVMYLQDSLGNYNYIVSVDPSGRANFQYVNGASHPILLDTAVIPLNTWTQVTIVVTAATSAAFYINASHTSTQTSVFAVPGAFSGGTVKIGNLSPTNQLDGALDELQLYAGNMSTNLISMLYANESSPSTFYIITSNVAWTAECTIDIGTGCGAKASTAYAAACTIPIVAGVSGTSNIGYGAATCTIPIVVGLDSGSTEAYNSAKCTIPIVVGIKIQAAIGTIGVPCLSGVGESPIVSPTFDPGYTY
jgi:hypothetical protein